MIICAHLKVIVSYSFKPIEGGVEWWRGCSCLGDFRSLICLALLDDVAKLPILIDVGVAMGDPTAKGKPHLCNK